MRKIFEIVSLLVLFSIFSLMTIPTAFADHATASVSVSKGSSVPGCEETNSCYAPYKVTIDVGGEVTWNNVDSAAHTVTAGSAAYGPSGVFDSSLFMAGTTFSHQFDEEGTFPYFCMVHPWMEGVVVVGEIVVNKDDEDAKILAEIYDFEIPEGEWCIEEDEVKTQMKQNPKLNSSYAPLCASEEITMENVRAARSVNVDNLLGKITALKESDFVNSTSQGNIINKLENIRTLIFEDKIIETVDNYKELRIVIDSTITNQAAKDDVLKVLDYNNESLLNSVPEFETVAILILILSITAIVLVTRTPSIRFIRT